MPVTGVGGLFFRAKNPDALQQWYRDHLGVMLEGGAPWIQAAGPTVIVQFADSGIAMPDARWLGPVASDELGLIQWIEIEQMLTDDVQALLFQQPHAHSS